MTSLIKRLEEAGGPDREIDVEIVKALGGAVRFVTSIGTRYQVFWPDMNWDYPDDLPELPHYTASIDSALTLFADEKEAIGELWVAAAAASSKWEVLQRLISAALRARGIE